MKGKHLGWIAGGAGVLLLVAAIYFVNGYMRGAPKRAVFDYQWNRCEAGEQCVVVPAPCGEWEAVNARFRTEAAAYYAHLIDVVEKEDMLCVSTSLSMRMRGAYCLSGTCTLAR